MYRVLARVLQNPISVAEQSKARFCGWLLTGIWIQIPPGAWVFHCFECCVLSGWGLCIGPITHPEVSYRVWCVWVWLWSLDSEEALVYWGCCFMKRKRKKNLTKINFVYATKTLQFTPVSGMRTLYSEKTKTAWMQSFLSWRWEQEVHVYQNTQSHIVNSWF